MRSDLTLLRMVQLPGCAMAHVAVYAALHTRSTFKPSHPNYGWARASVERLCALTGLSRRTVIRSTQWLQRHRLVTIRRTFKRTQDGSRQGVNWYWLLGAPAETPGEGSQSATGDTLPRPKRGARVSPVAPSRVSPVTPQLLEILTTPRYKQRSDAGAPEDAGAAEVHTHREGNGTGTAGPGMPGFGAGPGQGAPNPVDPSPGSPGEPNARPTRSSRETWLTPYWDDWKAAYGGEPAAGPLCANLRKLHQQHGLDLLRPAWQRYLVDTEARFASPARFKQIAGTYLGTAPATGTRAARVAMAVAAWRAPESPDPDGGLGL